MEKQKKNQSSIKHRLFPLVTCLLFGMGGTVQPMLAADVQSVRQVGSVRGVVLDSQGMPIIGASVLVKGTTNGVITDFDGNFEINVSTGILQISYVGFKTQEVKIDSKTNIKVVLEEDSELLDEVVVVGFGTQKKETLTGAVTQIKGDDLMNGKSSSNAALAMQGEIPGLVVTRTSPRPGNEDIDIKIRGDISVNGTEPLILLDGLEIPQWQLGTLNPNDIESMSVLKDGAAAIYGTKAAGGVILITTKKGKQGKVSVDYKGELQLNFTKDFPLTELDEWAQMWLEAGDNDAIKYLDKNGNEQTAASNYRFFTRDELLKIIDGTFPMREAYTWYDGKVHRFDNPNLYDMIYGTTVSHRHNVSISGGNEKVTYRTSLGFADERSPMKFVYDGAKRYNFRTNISYKVNDLISTDFNVSYDHRDISEPNQGVGEGIQDAWFFPMYNDKGQYYDLWGNNPLCKLDEGGRNTTIDKIFRLGGKITLDLDKYVKGLKFTYLGNISSRGRNKTSRKTQRTMYDWDGNISVQDQMSSTSVKVELEEIFFQNHVIQGNYNRSFGKNNIGLMLGMTAEEQQKKQYEMFRSNMSTNDLDDIKLGDVTTQTNDGGSNGVGLVSYIGKINYDYNGIYLLEALGRRDGSSRLYPDYRWKNFFSVSGGIRFSEMSFLKDGVFQNLKLRASYGETGSVTGIGEYDYISNIAFGDIIFGSSPALANTARIDGMTSLERTCERVANTNIALDFTTFNGKLNGTFEWYHRTNNDMLISVTYPQILGATAPKTNSGDFKTNGWEFSLNWNDKIGEVKYNVGLMLWDSKSEITRMDGATAIKAGTNKTVEGKPLNAIYTYVTDGIFDNEEDILAYYNKYGFKDPSNQNVMKPGTLLPNYRSADRLVPGTVKRVDINGDNEITIDDLQYYGDANPHYSFGLNLGLQWKGFDVSAFFQGVMKQNIQRTGHLSSPFASWWTNQNVSFLGNTWTPENTDAKYPAMYYNGARKTWNYTGINDINIVNARYCRAKVISVGYTLPRSIVEKMKIQNLRFSLTGNDLFVISNVKDGMDPEIGTSVANGKGTVPFTSTLIFGVDLTF